MSAFRAKADIQVFSATALARAKRLIPRGFHIVLWTALREFCLHKHSNRQTSLKRTSVSIKSAQNALKYSGFPREEQ
jgi:hypothetical protein